MEAALLTWGSGSGSVGSGTPYRGFGQHQCRQRLYLCPVLEFGAHRVVAHQTEVGGNGIVGSGTLHTSWRHGYDSLS
jgi:hypothetical protein